jgi:DNA-binding GntR family transcriptional regulator
MIRQRELNPGEHLREQALASHFGVSRGPIREALSRLASTGLVNLIPGRGAEIPRLTDSEVSVNSDITGVLMGLAARRAALTGTGVQKQEFAEAVQQMHDAVEASLSGRGFLHFSELSLLAMVKAANSQSLERLVDQVVCLGPAITWVSITISTLTLQRQRVKRWKRLLKAVQEGDDKLAEREAINIQKSDLKAALDAGMKGS